jgi:uncharacterized protein YcfJ
MNRILLTIATIVIIAGSLPTSQAKASDRAVGGLLLGGGSGAIIGQTLGRSAEATIIGATVGGVLGVVIGNELDRHGHYPRVVQQQVIHHQPVHYSHSYRDRRDHRGRAWHQPPRQVCREVVTIKEGRHRDKRVVTTVCREERRGSDRYGWHRPHPYGPYYR